MFEDSVINTRITIIACQRLVREYDVMSLAPLVATGSGHENTTLEDIPSLALPIGSFLVH